MFQVYVTNIQGERIPVGPKSSEKGFAEQIAHSLRMALAQKRLTGWREPEVVQLLDAMQ